MGQQYGQWRIRAGILRRSHRLTLWVVMGVLLVSLACGGGGAPARGGLRTPGAPGKPKATAIAAATATEGTEDAPPEATDTPEPEPATPRVYEVGDVIDIGDLVIVVLGWELPPATEYNQPQAGNKFVAVEVLLVNRSEGPVAVSPVVQMSLKDGENRNHAVNLKGSAATGRSTPGGELLPGERVRGMVGFAVPETAQGFTLVFDPEVLRRGKVSVALGAEPLSLPAPEQVRGEQPVATQPPGEAVEVQELVLVVNGVTFPEGNNLLQPRAGYQFVAVDVTFENLRAEAFTLAPLFQMKLKDGTGQKYDANIVGGIVAGSGTPEGELSPGEKLRGEVVFQVPVGTEGLLFEFDPDLFGYGKALVALP